MHILTHIGLILFIAVVMIVTIVILDSHSNQNWTTYNPVNFAHAIKILTIGDLDCSHDSLETIYSILSYSKENKINRFVFLGDIDYGDSYVKCGEKFLEDVSEFTELRMIR